MNKKTRSFRVAFFAFALAMNLIASKMCGGEENKAESHKTVNIHSLCVSNEADRLDESQGHAIPFDYQPPQRPLITIQISVNKSKPLTFLVDTGAEMTFFLLPWAKEKLNLHSTGETVELKPSNTMMQALDGCNIELMAQAPSHNAPIHIEKPWSGEASILELYPGSRIAGILGGELFSAITTRFDFDKKIFTLFYDKHMPLQLPSPAITLPLIKIDGGSPPQVKLSFPNNLSSIAMIDIGSTVTTLPAEMAKKVTSLSKTKTYLANLGGSSETEKLLLSQLTVGSATIPIVPVTVGASSSQALLGIDLLSRFRVTLDGRNGFLTLEPRAHYERQLIGNPGITIATKNDNFYVDAITAPSPLTAAIRVGDKVNTIDGRSTKGMKLIEAVYSLNDYEGTDAKLTLERADGKTYEVTLPRRSDFRSVVRVEAGIRLLADTKNTLNVIEVEPKSLAARVGIEVGDELIEIDGKPAKKMSLDEIISKLEVNGKENKQTKMLSLKRKRDGKSIGLEINKM